jgi:hypothetical protein
MNKTVFIGFIFLLALQVSCFGQKKRDRSDVKPDTVSVDSLEYKLIVLDPGFESWLVTQLPENFYSQQYYETKNRMYVTEWNQRYMSGRRNKGLYDTYIDYDFNTDYGMDLNYRLYYYFRYFEITNHIRLISTSR